ncbi:TetR/AcrR family transcriptional regulator [Salibacterium halotolerans]|uniref:DNA-binding transcriptional regulator, AcrR family n=1 Tax=Salibacterium halotolerans TaxID=1884432 RepID=A0A1I5QSQ0_9BACI|nr:TetR/AcrR family transcriptional regulator [Salibacterium halotolerans]SFP48876.1 DNA-binding transcriptional regulator, AcrR family [Salibacterium halotolerans]
MDSEQKNVSSTTNRGRPRSETLHRNILDATLSLLNEVGVEKLSIEMIAQRAGVGKTSIYRRWANKEALVLDTLEQVKPELNLSIKDNLHDTLYEIADSFFEQMNTPLGKQMLSVLVSTLSGSSQISETFWERHSLPKTKEISSIIDHFRLHEGLSDNVSDDLASDLLNGYVMYLLLFKPPSKDFDSSLKRGIEIIVNGMKKSD